MLVKRIAFSLALCLAASCLGADARINIAMKHAGQGAVCITFGSCCCTKPLVGPVLGGLFCSAGVASCCAADAIIVTHYCGTETAKEKLMHIINQSPELQQGWPAILNIRERMRR